VDCNGLLVPKCPVSADLWSKLDILNQERDYLCSSQASKEPLETRKEKLMNYDERMRKLVEEISNAVWAHNIGFHTYVHAEPKTKFL